MTHWWVMAAWTVAGATVGAALGPTTRGLLTTSRPDHPYLATVNLTITTAILFGLLAWRIGPHPDLLAYSYLAAVGVPLAAVDLAEHRLPARLLLPAYPALLALFGLAAALEHDATPFIRALAGMVILGAFYLTIALTTAGSLGAADIRLAGILGLALAWRGWTTLTAGTLLALLYAAATGAILITLRRATRHTPIPFGPALIAGTITALLINLE